MSSGNIIHGLSWTRSTTTLTVNSVAHGLTTGDWVVLRGFNVDYFYADITSTGANTFTCQVADSGATSGTGGAYVPAMEMVQLNDTIITLAAPSSGNVQMISMTIFLADSQDQPKTLTVPVNAETNGAGINSALNNLNPASFDAYGVAGSVSSKINSGTLYFSTTSGFGTYSMGGGLDIFGPVILTFKF